MPVEQLVGLDDLEHRGDRARVLVGDRRPERVVARRAADTRARSPCSTSRASSRGSARACGRTATPGRAAAARRRRRDANAVPQPYHDGSSAAVLRPREDPRDRAQRREVVLALRPARGTRADVEQRELVDRRERAEERRRSRGSSTSARYTLAASASASSATSAVSPSAPASGNAASSVAASADSRLRCASPGSPYLNAIVSPCSVTFSRPGGSPCGCARIAAYVGPPPRPALPPRPWKTVSSDAAPPRDVGERDERAADLPLRREVARVLRRVRVADHHLAAADRVEQLLVDARRGAQRVDRLEERHERRAARS